MATMRETRGLAWYILWRSFLMGIILALVLGVVVGVVAGVIEAIFGLPKTTVQSANAILGGLAGLGVLLFSYNWVVAHSIGRRFGNSELRLVPIDQKDAQ